MTRTSIDRRRYEWRLIDHACSAGFLRRHNRISDHLGPWHPVAHALSAIMLVEEVNRGAIARAAERVIDLAARVAGRRLTLGHFQYVGAPLRFTAQIRGAVARLASQGYENGANVWHLARVWHGYPDLQPGQVISYGDALQIAHAILHTDAGGMSARRRTLIPNVVR